jgi:cytochrome P450
MMQLAIVIIGHRLFGRDIDRQQAKETSTLMRECQEYVTNRMLSFDLARGRFERNMTRLRAMIESLAAHADRESIAALLGERCVDRASQIDHLLGLLVAGHETTAVALTWTAMLLAKHPEIQERARREGGAFLRAVVEESMRLYPPVPCFARRAIADDVLAGHRIRKGSKVIVAPHVTHRLPRFWAEPERFVPERFMPERRAAIAPHAYFPFGMGPRTCIGASMAMMECRVVLETILERVVLEPAWGPEEPRARAEISLHPDRPVIVRVALTTASGSAPRAPSAPPSSVRRRAALGLAGSPSGRPIESTA